MAPTGAIIGHPSAPSKKSDEYSPRSRASSFSGPTSWLGSFRRVRKRRLFAVVAVAVLVYFFVLNIPKGLQPVNQRVDTRSPGRTFAGIPIPKFNSPGKLGRPKEKGKYDTPRPMARARPGKPPPRPKPGSDAENPHWYDGQISFVTLASSLQAIARKLGYASFNKNVMFVAANVQSAARLIPLACEMQRWERNLVHFVYMGRDDVSMQELKEVNGAKEGCEMFWHDARPEFAPWSTDARMEEGVTRALLHMLTFIHPQVYISVDLHNEEIPFSRPLRARAYQHARALIELPNAAPSTMMWMTRLDSVALSAWYTTNVDIVIQANAETAGSLRQLLQSIEGADYFGLRYPHITIELPENVEHAQLDDKTQRYLNQFTWPPTDPEGRPHTSRFTLRRRIPVHQYSPLEASARLVESFYPAQPRDSHVLVLSPSVELSPLYYHFLHYHVLEYRHSAQLFNAPESDLLMGISLLIPTTQLDGQTPFHLPPPTLDLPAQSPTSDPDLHATPFLYQAPATHAALYFGSKWLELHSFLSHQVLQSASLSAPILPHSFPAFAQPVLDLMRLRGYAFLYPALPAHAVASTAHNAPSLPPEYLPLPADTPNPLTTQPHPPPPRPLAPPYAALTDLLPAPPAHLPAVPALPLLSHAGEHTDFGTLRVAAAALADAFRETVGACPADQMPAARAWHADDLFCDTADPALLLDTAGAGTAPTAPGYGRGDTVRGGMMQGAVHGARAQTKGKTMEVVSEGEQEAARTVEEKEKEELRREWEAHMGRQGKWAAEGKAEPKVAEEKAAGEEPVAAR